MKRAKRIFIFLAVAAIFFTNGYIYAGVTDVTGGSGVTVKTTVRDNYTDFQITDNITLEKSKDYIIDFTKEDNLSKGLSALADLEKTVYYKIIEGEKASLSKTENISEATIKIVGNKDENKAIMTLINTDSNKTYDLDFTYIQHTGSKLTYTGTDYDEEEIIVGDPVEIKDAYGEKGKVTINEIRDDYYSRYYFKCQLNLIAIPAQEDIPDDSKTPGENTEKSNNPDLKDDELVKNETTEISNIKDSIEPKDVKQDSKENTNSNPKTGDNVIVYFVLAGVSILGIATLVIINNKKSKKEN